MTEKRRRAVKISAGRQSPAGISLITKEGGSSMLAPETFTDNRRQREAEQNGHSKLSHVNKRNHEERKPETPGEQMHETMLQHPALDKQYFDGVDPNLSPEPPLNSEARREFDNERREQEQEKQLRLGLANAPKFSTAPKPHGP